MSLKELFNKNENRTPAQIVCQDVLKIKKGERVLIISNPSKADIAQDFFLAASSLSALPTLIFQGEKTSFDNANPEVLAAIASQPEVCLSISSVKLGKDPEGNNHPYIAEDGTKYNHIFDYLLSGKKTMRAVWTPGITVDMMNRTAAIDYKELQSRCGQLAQIFENAVNVHVTSPGGTDINIPVKGRKLLFDNGDFSQPGSGGNIPAGEVFISPLVGESEGTIVYDGSMTFDDGDALLENPIICKVEKGFVTEIKGKEEARRLLKTITEAENRSVNYEKEGKLTAGQGAIYKKNARNIGELGIGLNPAAKITGNMLEDEKAFHTCHFAIGENYDNDAPSLIHLDGLVKEPSICLTYQDGSQKVIMENGELKTQIN